MALTNEQAKSIKEQLFKQVDNFPEDKKEQVRKYIEDMNNEELEQFLIKNKQMQGEAQGDEAEGEGKGKKGESQCVMCLISGKKIESLPIYEDKDYIAVLEINPMSKGHAILIPKAHVKSTSALKSKALTIAKKISKHIIKKLGAEDVQINTSDELGHAIVNIIPTYKGQKIDYQRKSAKKEELQDLAMKIGQMKKAEPKAKQTKSKEAKPEMKKEAEIIQILRRIP